MARRRKQTPELRQAELTDEQMRAGISRLKVRVADLAAFDTNSIQERWEPRLTALRDKVRSTVTDVLGADTVELHQFGHIDLDEAPMVLGQSMPLHVVRKGYADGIARMIAKLETLVELFEEKLGGAPEDPISRARRAFGDLALHPEVARQVTGLFESGHYANAVEDACKVLDALVKMRSGRDDLSGTELMQTVFSRNNPVLAFNDLQTDTDKSEQQGMMFLYAGTMLALRNPRAHELIEDHPETALEYIAFVSLLAKALDRARRA